MILPIYAYGHKVLKKVAVPLSSIDEEITSLISNMWKTMYNAHGVGLAAPQVGKSIRIFLVDTVQVMDDKDKEKGIKQAFINPQMVDESGEFWTYEEGCLSIPHVRADVFRQKKIRIKYQDENLEHHESIFSGINARVIQHEYDHLEGVLFTEKIKSLKKRLIKRRLDNIKKGNVSADYAMKYAVI